MTVKRNYGCRPSPADPRTHQFNRRLFAAVHGHQLAGRSVLDVSAHDPDTLDQGQTSSCTGHASAYGGANLMAACGQADAFLPSPYELYWGGRVEAAVQAALQAGMDPADVTDDGADLLSVCKSAGKRGVANFDLWPDDPAMINVHPSDPAMAFAAGHLLTRYEAAPISLDAIRLVLASGGGVIIGADVFSGMESEKAARTGRVDLPADGETPLGGHAMWVCGSNDKTRLVKFHQSWGAGWGENGFGYLPYDYFQADDAGIGRYVFEIWRLEAIV